MGKTFNPEEYDMSFCPVCNGKGKLPKNPGGLMFVKNAEVLGSLKRNQKEI